MAQQIRWHACRTKEDLAARAAAGIARFARETIDETGQFHIVLAGGGTPKAVYALLPATGGNWQSWRIYFGDERCLRTGDAGRNDVMARSSWLKHVPIPEEHVYPIPAQLGAAAAAAEYARALDGVQTFDLVLLGLGKDGHTASLFPGHNLGRETDAPAAFAVHDAPKDPRERVTLSANRLSRARHIIFMVTGKNKRAAVAEWRAGKDIPAAHITPVNGVDVLLTDDAAGGVTLAEPGTTNRPPPAAGRVPDWL